MSSPLKQQRSSWFICSGDSAICFVHETVKNSVNLENCEQGWFHRAMWDIVALIKKEHFRWNKLQIILNICAQEQVFSPIGLDFFVSSYAYAYLS